MRSRPSTSLAQASPSFPPVHPPARKQLLPSSLGGTSGHGSVKFLADAFLPDSLPVASEPPPSRSQHARRCATAAAAVGQLGCSLGVGGSRGIASAPRLYGSHDPPFEQIHPPDLLRVPSRGGLGSAGSAMRTGSSATEALLLRSAALEDEVRALRDALVLATVAPRYETAPSSVRRSMAAIAGGGFRAMSLPTQRPCTCYALRSKLAKMKVELERARAPQVARFDFSDTLDAASQTAPLPSPSIADALSQTAPIEVPVAPASPPRVEASAQASGAETTDACVGGNRCWLSACGTQTLLSDSGVQGAAPGGRACAAVTQTDADARLPEPHTPRGASHDAATQVDDLLAAPVAALAAAATPAREALEGALQRRAEEAEAWSRHLRECNQGLEAQLLDLHESIEVWRSAASSRALGQLQVTILCPRAECTVNGDHLSMDSWDPAKLRADFEEQVLPRFARVFVEEEAETFSHDSKGGFKNAEKKRPEAVKQCMQEFAAAFRQRLSAMLTAPSAAEAAQAGRETSSGSCAATATVHSLPGEPPSRREGRLEVQQRAATAAGGSMTGSLPVAPVTRPKRASVARDP